MGGLATRRYPDPGKKIGLGHSEQAFRPIDQNQQHGDGQQELARAEEAERLLDRMQRLGGDGEHGRRERGAGDAAAAAEHHHDDELEGEEEAEGGRRHQRDKMGPEPTGHPGEEGPKRERHTRVRVIRTPRQAAASSFSRIASMVRPSDECLSFQQT